jgi:GPH family glycoside/pentoside/hexuronide:cation symporter
MDPVPPTQHHHETAQKDRVSLREKIGLGFGRMVTDGTHGTLHVLINPIFNMTLGVNPALISTIIFIQRIWDAMLDPLFGQFSDNFRSKWGRRRPLMLMGALPIAALFAAIWWFPMGVSTNYLFWHLLLVSLGFYAAYALYTMPLNGLIVEATDDYHERTKLAGIALAFGFAAQIGSQWLFPLTQASFFSNSIEGVRCVAIGAGILFLIAALIPVFFCRERLYKKVTSKQAHVPFWASLKAASSNGSFMSLLCARAVFSFGYNVVGVMGGYMHTYYVFGGDIKRAAPITAAIGSCFHIAAIIMSLLVYPWIERHLGKRRTMQLACYVLLVDCAAKYWLYQPGHGWLPTAVIIMNGVANSGVSLMCIAMLGDIADQDEYQTGLRREGLFVALLAWFEKAGNSLGSFLTGFILVWIGFSAKLGGQTEHTLWLMKWSYIIFPAAGALMALYFVGRYRLTQDQVYSIKDELARRRAARAEGSDSTPQTL